MADTTEVAQITSPDNMPVDWLIKSHEGKVIVLLEPAVRVNELDPNNALDIAEAIAKAAFECQGVVVAGKALKADLADKAAKKLLPRIKTVLRDTEGKPPDYRASTIIATILSEVL